MRMKGTGKSVKKGKKDSDLKENVVFNIQSIIMSVLMAITLVTIVTMGFLLYQRLIRWQNQIQRRRWKAR